MRAEIQAELDRASAEIAGGDFGGARRRLLQLRARGEAKDAGEREAVEAALKRLRPDPVATALLVLCLLLFTGVVYVTLR
jgi:hypothetical protein